MHKYQQTRLMIAGGAAVTGVVLFLSLTDFDVVQSNELAVVRSFGVVQEKPGLPGAHLHWAWDKYERVTMQFDDMEFTADNQTNTSSISYVSADGYANEIPLSISWAIDPSNLTYVKARQPGVYSDRVPIIVRTAVRDVMTKTRYDDGSMMDRDGLEPKIREAIIERTAEYYRGLGFGDHSNHIVRYGMVSIRNLSEPGEITANKTAIIEAEQQAEIGAKTTKVPAGHTAASYSTVLKAQAFSKAAKDGNLSATAVDTGGANIGVMVK